MVTFVTLFLNLIIGTQPVVMAVESGVARVELLLDGETIGWASAAPWTVECDFGPALLPHELVAVAYDVEGREVGRTRQRVNVPRSRAEARLALEGGEPGAPTQARLTWDTVESQEPKSFHLTFDGEPLAMEDPGAILLPTYDPTVIHFLTAKILFAEDLEAQTTVGFGGALTVAVDTELTAVPMVALTKRPDSPSKEDAAGWFHKKGKPLEVFAVEKAAADLVVVVDQGAWRPLRRVGQLRQGNRNPAGQSWSEGVRRGDRFRFISTQPVIQQGSRDLTILFPLGENLGKTGKRGLPESLFRLRLPQRQTDQRLSDAVAAAGLEVAASNRPRLLVLVLGRDAKDRSQLRPQVVRDYLQQLGVPLVVWATYKSKGATTWGPATNISNPLGLDKAMRELAQELNRQAMVWLVGHHLLRDLELQTEDWGLAH